MNKDKAVEILTAHLGLPFYDEKGNKVARNPDLSGTNVREAIFFSLNELKGQLVKVEDKPSTFKAPITFPPVVK